MSLSRQLNTPQPPSVPLCFEGSTALPVQPSPAALPVQPTSAARVNFPTQKLGDSWQHVTMSLSEPARNDKFYLGPLASKRLAAAFRETWKSMQLIEALLKQKCADKNEPKEHLDFTSVDIGGELSFKKIICDVRYVEQLYRKLLEEISESNSFSTLDSAIRHAESEQELKKDFIALYQGRKWKQKHIERTDRIGEIQNQLRGLEKIIFMHKRESEQELDAVKEQIKESREANPLWLEYEEKLSTVQLENLKLRLEKQNEELEDKLTKVNRELPLENKAHDSIMYYLEVAQEKLNSKLQYWNERYSREKEEMEGFINDWNEKVEEEEMNIRKLQQEYSKYEAVVIEHERRLAEQVAEVAEEERREAAAVRLQAMWRGCSVRRALAVANLKKKPKKKTKK
ncbi:IQ motif EF-hand binding site [Trinorchestia longiramus]|nr:IQ motif EF-hand binding site [Trinorchestia longiramus]